VCELLEKKEKERERERGKGRDVFVSFDKDKRRTNNYHTYPHTRGEEPPQLGLALKIIFTSFLYVHVPE
jgi:hypothetical protein